MPVNFLPTQPLLRSPSIDPNDKLAQLYAQLLMKNATENDKPIMSHWQGANQMAQAAMMGLMLQKERQQNADTLKGQGNLIFGPQQPGAQPSAVPDATPSNPISGLGNAISGSFKGIGNALGFGGGGDAGPPPAPVQTDVVPQNQNMSAAPPNMQLASLQANQMGSDTPPPVPPMPIPQVQQPPPASMMSPQPSADQPAPLTGGAPGIDRSAIAAQIQSNPELIQRLAGMVKGETGFRDPRQATIQTETALNRATAQGIPLGQALLSVKDDPRKGYYASDTYSRQPSPSEAANFRSNILPQVLGGSDVSTQMLGFPATGNASQMGFAGRRAAQGLYDNYKWYTGQPGVGEMYVQGKNDAARFAKNARSTFGPEMLSGQPMGDPGQMTAGALPNVQMANVRPTIGLPGGPSQPPDNGLNQNQAIAQLLRGGAMPNIGPKTAALGSPDTMPINVPPMGQATTAQIPNMSAPQPGQPVQQPPMLPMPGGQSQNVPNVKVAQAQPGQMGQPQGRPQPVIDSSQRQLVQQRLDYLRQQFDAARGNPAMQRYILEMAKPLQEQLYTAPKYETKDIGGHVLRVQPETGAVQDITPKGFSPDTNDIREYNTYAAQETAGGRQPLSFLKYQEQLKRAGSSSVNVNQGENAYDKEMGQQFAKRYGAFVEGGDKAFGTLGSLTQMRQAMADPNFYSGIGAESASLPLKQLNVILGGDPKAAASMENFRALSSKAALDGMGGSLGTGFSNADRDFIVNQYPSLGSTPEGNMMRISGLEKIERRKIDVARLAQEYVQQNGRMDAGFDRKLSAWREQNPVFSDAERADIMRLSGGGTQPSAAKPAQPSIDDLLKKYGPK